MTSRPTMDERKQARLQVPMTQAMLDVLQKRAVELGFNSAPAYIRFWAANDLKRSTSGELELNEGCKIALRYCELVLAHRSPLPASAHQALDCISLQLRQRASRLARRYKDKDLR